MASSAEFTDMGRVGHYMFRRVARWNDYASSRSLAFVTAQSSETSDCQPVPSTCSKISVVSECATAGWVAR